MRVAMLVLAVSVLVTSACCAHVVVGPELWLGASDFQWDGELGPGDVVVCDLFLQVDGTDEWIKTHDDVPWDVATVDTLEVAYDLGTHYSIYTKLWFRTDVLLAMANGDTFEYSCASSMEDPEPWYVGRPYARWHGRPR